MKVLFFGTPQIAVPYLDWLSVNADVVGLVCKPDEPVGRGYKITPPPTKVLAVEKNIPVFPWQPDILQSLKSLEADIGVAVAYGRIMPESVIQIPKLGTLNIHFSLLPKYRGAAPIQWSLIRGEKETGVTLFWLDKGMDTGPICRQDKITITPDENAVSLKEKLVPLGVESLSRVLKDLEQGQVNKIPQEGEGIPAPMLKKEIGNIDWTKSAEEISDLIAGIVEWPGARTKYTVSNGDKILKIFRASVEPGQKSESAGKILEAVKNGPIRIQCGSGVLNLIEVQPEGKKRMPAAAFWQGAHLKEGDRLKPF